MGGNAPGVAVSSLKPPFDHQSAPHTAPEERREPSSQPNRPSSAKRKTQARELSPDKSEPTPKNQRSHERLAQVSEQMRGLMTPVHTDAPARAKLNPAQRAERSLQTFEKLLAPASHEELTQTVSKLLPLTDHPEGFKCFSAAMPDGSVFQLSHCDGDAQAARPPQHIELAMFLSFMLVKQKHLPASQWREHLRAAPSDSKVPSNLLRAGSRLIRRNGKFFLAPSSSFDLPAEDDPNYDAYVKLHAQFLRGAGAAEVSVFGATDTLPPTPPPSTPGSESDRQLTPEPKRAFGSRVEAMCQAINDALKDADA